MKNTVLLLGLMAVPTMALAGGAGNMSLYDASNAARTTTTAAPAGLSSENPVSILESRDGADVDQNLMRYSFGYIPNSFWAEYNGDLQDINGFIEAEEYFGETRRAQYDSGEYLEREDERQDRAQNKASRLRFIGR